MSAGTPVQTVRMPGLVRDQVQAIVAASLTKPQSRTKTLSSFIIASVEQRLKWLERCKRAAKRRTAKKRLEKQFRKALEDSPVECPVNPWKGSENMSLFEQWQRAGCKPDVGPLFSAAIDQHEQESQKCDKCQEATAKPFFGGIFITPIGVKIILCWKCLVDAGVISRLGYSNL
jgi:hypothetical protein